ncbi:MAG: Holliday junction branch migration protein RuvA [Chitinophagaceae bacterium]|nr:MAG: Holliday junction branch migration protein RuvA [Chitinophagaceae bacterium]
MYAYLSGDLTFKSPAMVYLDVNGVGYEVNISLHTWSAIQHLEKAKLYTWFQVKEDAHTLYGFADEGERRLFLHLISVSGIGPTTCRMMLSSITPVEIQNAIIQADVALIQQIKGIGAKSAQRIVLELQDKLKKEGPDSLISMPLHNTTRDEALSALIMLGFGKQVADKALDNAIKKADQDLTVEQMIKVALKNL